MSNPRKQTIANLPKPGLFAHLVQGGQTSVEEIAQITGRSESTVRRWVNQRTVPDAVDFHLIITRVQSDEVRRRLINLLLGSLPVALEWRDPEMDEGPGNPHDHAADAVYHVARLLKRLQAAAARGNSIADNDREEFRTIAAEAINSIMHTRDHFLAGAQKRRNAT